jgi:hypothetical protein
MQYDDMASYLVTITPEVLHPWRDGLVDASAGSSLHSCDTSDFYGLKEGSIIVVDSGEGGLRPIAGCTAAQPFAFN